MRYAASEAEAEDILQDGFVTVFAKIETYAGTGQLGGWIRRVMINTALMHYRKNKKYQMNVDLEDAEFFLASDDSPFDRISARDLMHFMQRLPAGCRMVFNLYAVEGYNHKEIAERMEVSVGTSKSQYSRARGLLRNMIETEEKRVSGRAI